MPERLLISATTGQIIFGGKLKRTLIVATVLLCVFAVKISAEQTSVLAANLKAGKKQTIVAYGTSLTEKGVWVDELQKKLNELFPGKATVLNKGGQGMYSKWGVDNLEERVIKNKPDAVLIEFAINDVVGRFNCSVPQAKENLEFMIKRILEQNPKCEIVLMTTTPGDLPRKKIPEYYDVYRSVAKVHKFLLVDMYPQWLVLLNSDKKTYNAYVPDLVHPSPDGCKFVVLPAILRTLGIPVQH